MLIDRIKCDICNSEKSTNFLKYPEYPGLKIVKCKRCGFVYVTPIPNLETIKQQNIYTDFDRLYQKNRNSKKVILYQIIVLLRKCGKTEGDLLDVGCNVGYFLDIARTHGYRTSGIDINPDFIEYTKSRKHKTICGTLSQANIEKDSYDVVVMLEMLEHTISPSCELKEAKRVLKNNGILVVEVPNTVFHLLKGKFEKLIKSEVVGLNPTRHYNHFTHKTIKRFMEGEGFEVLGVYVGKPAYISPMFGKVIGLLNTILQRFLCLFFKLTNIHLGSRIIVIARKK